MSGPQDAAVHAPCRCCGDDLCFSRLLDVWFHARPPAEPHLPDPDLTHANGVTS